MARAPRQRRAATPPTADLSVAEGRHVRLPYDIIRGEAWEPPPGVPSGAKLHRGVWLPDREEHLVGMLTPGTKRYVEINGRPRYQFHKLGRTLELMQAAGRPLCGALDIGAHVGLWSMTLVERFADVVAVEPHPAHAALFPWNMARATNWTLHKVAACALEGRQLLLAGAAGSSGDTHVVGDAAAQPGMTAPVAVAAMPLDDLDLHGPDLVKLDVEGYELPALQGLRATLLRERPFVIVEDKGKQAAYGLGAPGEALAYLEGLGMRRLDAMSGDFILSF